jgi:hypothetical protein
LDRHPHSELHTVMRRDATGVCNHTFRGTGSYRLIARNVGLSKNSVMEIVKREAH